MISAESKSIILRGIWAVRERMIDAYILYVRWGADQEATRHFYCRICRGRGPTSVGVAHRTDCDCAIFFAKCDQAISEVEALEVSDAER